MSHIPKIIHQTYKTEDIPDHWRTSQESWKAMHPDWEYRFWTDCQLRNFIFQEFPAFLPVYDSYSYHIQRVDAARYFILYRYGGLYADLDIICLRPFDQILNDRAIIPKTEPLGYSNDLMLAPPGHPLFKSCIENLSKNKRKYENRCYIPRHLMVLLTTGPLFITQRYNALKETDSVYILPYSLYNNETGEPLVRHIKGDSWHKIDSQIFGWIADHTLLVFSLLILILLTLMIGVSRL